MGDGDKKLNVEISVHAELTALREYEAQLTRQIAHTRALGKASDSLEADLEKVRGKLSQFSWPQKLGAELTEFASKIPGVGMAVNALNGNFLKVASAGVVLNEAGQFIKAAVAAFEQAEQRLVGLRAALALTGQANTANEQSVMALVKAQKEFAIAGSESQPVIETLLKLGRVRVDQLGQEVNLSKVWRL